MGRVSENDIIAKYQEEFRTHFKTSSFFTVIAPGRINIIGEHTDYNLGLAMPIAINRWICTVISLRGDNNINIYASNFDEHISLSIDDVIAAVFIFASVFLFDPKVIFSSIVPENKYPSCGTYPIESLR